MVFGEQFLERKIEGNKVIITREFKEFEGDYLGIVQDINDFITDDWEAQIDYYGIYCDRYGDWDCIDCDLAHEGISQHIEEEQKDYDSVEEWEEDCRDWKKELALLEKAKGFNIQLNRKKSFYYEQNNTFVKEE